MEQEIITTAAVTPAAPIDFAELMNKQQQARTAPPTHAPPRLSRLHRACGYRSRASLGRSG